MVTASRSATDLFQSIAAAARALADVAETAIQMQEGGSDELYSLSEAAQKLRVSTDWLRDQCREGKVGYHHLAGQYFLSASQIAAVLDRSRKEAK